MEFTEGTISQSDRSKFAGETEIRLEGVTDVVVIPILR